MRGRLRKKNRKKEPEDESEKLRFCELPSDAPPATKDSKGLITQRDRYYGTNWRKAGGITFEEDNFSGPSSGSGIVPDALDIGTLSAKSTPKMRMSVVRPSTTMLAERARPMTREERLDSARRAMTEYKWKNNGMCLPSTPVPPRSTLLVREEGDFLEHMHGKLSPWKPTPRALRDPQYVRETIRQRLDITGPQEYVNFKPKLPQAITVQAIMFARLSKSKGRHLETRLPYRPVERKLFESPYNKPCWGPKFAYEPKLNLSSF